MMAEFLICLAGVLVFGLTGTLVLPANWDPLVDDEGEAVADSLLAWWRRYRGYRKVVSDEYSRHDGTQRMMNPRRYHSPPNLAPPPFPAVALNHWFAQPVCEPERVGRHLELVVA